MAEDPKVRAHNEAERLKRIREQEEAARRRASQSSHQMQKQMDHDRREREKSTGNSSTGCAMIGLLVASSAPAAWAAWHWIA